MKFDPLSHLSGESHVTRGPIVVDGDGKILSGHDRHKELKQAYSNPEQGMAYKHALVNHSLRFKVDPLKIARMKQPVLVRKIQNQDLPHTQPGSSPKV